MDFLDPRKKQRRRLQLIISYSLMAVLAIGGALIMFYSSLGYGINTSTGKIVQNGLVFIDSAPVKAEIFINGQDANKKTSARLVLPEDSYKLSLTKPGYRSWDEDFALDAQSVLRLNYALMIPTNLRPTELASSQAPLLTSQTPDSKYIVALMGGSKLSLNTYSGDSFMPQPAALPAGLAKLSGGSWQSIGWSSNNNLLLLEHTSGKQMEYVIVNRSNPALSINLTSAAGDIAEARWVPGSKSQLYLLKGNSLDRYDLESSKLSSQFGGLQYFEPLAGNRIIYSSSTSRLATIKVWDGVKSYPLAQLQLATGVRVLLAADSYQGHEYYVVSSTAQDKASIYEDPLASMRASSGTLPKPTATLKIKQPSQLSFSSSGRILLADSSQSVSTYDIDEASSMVFTPKYQLKAPLVWADDYRLSGLADSSVAVVTDYNGANQQMLVKSNLPAGVYFNSSDTSMFSYLSSTHSFQKTSLVVPAN